MSAIEAKISGLAKKMGASYALNNISTLFEAGQVHGIIGPDGSGKTTLMRIIAGLLHPDAGSVEYKTAGKILSTKETKNYIAYFPQEPSLYPDLSCAEHLEFFRDLYNLGKNDFEIRSAELLNATNMLSFASRPAGKLSGGMYKKLGLMCVLLNRPKLLLLDEATVGVDPISRQQLWDLVYRFAGRDTTVIINTSYMDEARRCAKVHVLGNGCILATGAPHNLMREFKINNFADIFLKNGKR
ncbi:MAG: ABC transporter ATP-binding protein [Elusimicrobiota bacterium]|jgi:ABC-2 type transport system ATP-binding protein|nr:ABC transporter ATP-binding protein [Elusimicrobiota bacterium]